MTVGANANAIEITGTSFIPIGSTGTDESGVVVFEVIVPSAVAMDVQTRVQGSGETPVDNAYYNVRTNINTVVAAGTDITAAGIYMVRAPGCEVGLKASSGAATVVVNRLRGAV
jgi:hypothetical protein